MRGFAEQEIQLNRGMVNRLLERPIEKIHAIFHVMERDDHRILLSDLELHYINMRAFTEELRDQKGTGSEARSDMFTKWLILITEKEIADKEILRKICEEEEVIKVAVETLARLSEDKIKRQAYQRRLDELYSYNRLLASLEESNRRAEESEHRAEESEHRAEEFEHRWEESEHRAEEFEHRWEESERHAKESERRAKEFELRVKELERRLEESERRT